MAHVLLWVLWCDGRITSREALISYAILGALAVIGFGFLMLIEVIKK